MTHDLVISNGTAVALEHGSFVTDVAVDGETISAVATPGTSSDETEISATGKYMLPGAIDPHTHHGIYRGLEADTESESKSDLIGGATTIGNYFRRTGTYEDIISGYFDEAESDYHRDYFFSLGLPSTEHVEEILVIIKGFGIAAFKWHVNYKDVACKKFGVDRDMYNDFGDTFARKPTEQDISMTLGYHSENVEITNALAGGNAYITSESDGTDTDADEDCKVMVEEFPGYIETQSMIAGAAFARVHGCDGHFYMVHISVGGTTDELAVFHDAGYRAWGKTRIHHLVPATEEYDEHMKVNPPVRSGADQEMLWERPIDGTVSTVGTDHCADLMEGKFDEDIRGNLLGFSLAPMVLLLILLRGVNEGRISLERAVEVMGTNAAKVFNLYPRKGAVRVDNGVDLTVVGLDEMKMVMPELLHNVNGYSPHGGRVVISWPTQTVVKGEPVYDDGDIVGMKRYRTHIDWPV